MQDEKQNKSAKTAAQALGYGIGHDIHGWYWITPQENPEPEGEASIGFDGRDHYFTEAGAWLACCVANNILVPPIDDTKMKTVYISLNFSAKIPVDVEEVYCELKDGEIIVKQLAYGTPNHDKELARETEFASEMWDEDEVDGEDEDD